MPLALNYKLKLNLINMFEKMRILYSISLFPFFFFFFSFFFFLFHEHIKLKQIIQGEFPKLIKQKWGVRESESILGISRNAENFELKVKIE